MALKGNTVITGQVVVPILVDAVSAAYENNPSIFVGTQGALVEMTLPPDAAASLEVEVPYFMRFGKAERVIDGKPITPQQLTSTGEKSPVEEYGIGAKISDWSRGGRVPTYEEAGQQIMLATMEAADDRALDVAVLSPVKIDEYSNTQPRNLDYDLLAEGRTELGDEGVNESPVVLAVHTMTLRTMLMDKDAIGRPRLIESSIGADGRPMMRVRDLGIPIITSDKLAVAAQTAGQKTLYRSLLVYRDAIAFWGEARPRIEQARDIWVATSDLVSRHKFVVHRYIRRPRRKKPGVVVIEHNAES